MISIRRRPLLLGAMLLPGTLRHVLPAVAARQATPAVATAGGWTEAWAINDADQIMVSEWVNEDVTGAILTLDGEVVDVGAMAGPFLGMNNRGQVVGLTGSHRAVLWDDGQVTDLPMSFTSDINDAGQVCGSHIGGGPSVVWEDGELAELPLGPGDQASRALAINNVGQVVGWTGIGWVRYRPVLWDKGERIELPAPPEKGNATPAAGEDRPYAAATCISDAGHIVGLWDDVPVLWRDGAARVLPMPAGTGWSAGAGLRFAVNSRGQIAGSCLTENRVRAVWWEDGEAMLLPMLPGDVMSWAWDLNEAGQVVGQVVRPTDDGERSRAVLWQDGEVIDLSAIGRE